MVKVVLLRIHCLLNDPTDTMTHGTGLRQGLHGHFDLVFHRVWQFVSALGKKLDAIIWHGIMAGGNHNSHVSTIEFREVGNGRRGQHPYPQHINTTAGHACRQRSRKHFSRHTRVSPHHSQWAAFR